MLVSQYPKEIQVFFVEIVQTIREALNPDYILIAGSFGKGSWLYYNQELISDFEFVFICKKRWSLKKKQQLLKKLNSNYPYEISLKGFLSKKVSNKVISNYAIKNPGYLSLDFFDTFSDPKFLYRKNNHDIEIDCKVNEIPNWEAWRLYVNRMGDILGGIYSSTSPNNKINNNYSWLKIFESTADAYLIINKKYQKDINKRLELFDINLIHNDSELSENCKKSFSIIKSALVSRSKNDLSFFDTCIDLEKNKNIVNEWMTYFEKKLCQEESLKFVSKEVFYGKYLKNNTFQKKFLNHKYWLNITISNVIKLMTKPKLLNLKFKFYNLGLSWRHVSLLLIASTFNELKVNSNGSSFDLSKAILKKLILRPKVDKMQNDIFIKTALTYWKLLR